MTFIASVGAPSGLPAAGRVNTSRYRRVDPGDFVYNPMRINVGSIALCRSESEAGHASPDYVVFRVKPDAPFGPEYLLRYLQSSIGLRQIQRNAQGTIRSRLYFDNLCHVQFPLPAHPEKWVDLLAALDQVRNLLLELPQLGGESLSALLDSLFLWIPPAENESLQMVERAAESALAASRAR
jgi:type I restriction enzyme M protein